MWLASVGAVTCLLDGNIGEIVAVPGGADLTLSVFRECAAIAGACGYPISETFLAEKSPQLTAPGSTLTSSMYRDLKEQAPVEVDSILGDLIERRGKHGISAPLLQAAFVRLTIYQWGRAAAKAARVDRDAGLALGVRSSLLEDASIRIEKDNCLAGARSS